MIRPEVQAEIEATRAALAALRVAIEMAHEVGMSTDYIIALAETYAEHTGLKLSTISTYAANDGKWLGNLKSGASCTLRKAEVVVAWLDEHWGDDLEWPRHIQRPSAKRRAE